MIEPHRTRDFLLIRTALEAEAADIAALHLHARSTYYPDGLPDDGTGWRARWQEAVERPDGQVLCAVRDGHLAGIASFRTPPDAPADTVKLFQFHVDPGRWRAGIGTALHTACVEEWRANGRRTAVLEVHAGNRRAQAFYARQGWIPDPEHPPAEDDHHLHLCFAVPGE
ncbi:GNAT family N-acetyltransferase [Streptomyces sp. M2CJ-2]|uniref:GNAT family N-acetyltransferase n=1 Tax=Streptomyces sp. M2CJ-2 TaxID=2803948 RepID=UPI0019277A5D|nr:GNAT family N-acetyltransferase [Streptomyces sp. M2CJ-2]MBL3667310.1 GNAT family N-acetyltransferase [Streptomyces sp. M2CJ-2]